MVARLTGARERNGRNLSQGIMNDPRYGEEPCLVFYPVAGNSVQSGHGNADNWTNTLVVRLVRSATPTCRR